MTSLANLSRKELLATCETLIRELGADRAQGVLAGIVKPRIIATLTSTNDANQATSGGSATTTSSLEPLRKKQKQKKEFDMSRYSQKQVAFWVGYFGEHYSGLATAAPKNEVNDGTVEWSLLAALKKTKLIDPVGDFESWTYSKCGRTDSGVSALGQVISMKVRWGEGDKEMDYPSMLNNNLPKDIMVLAWAPVEDGASAVPGGEAAKPAFSARFNCRTRTYRYFFRPNHLNLSKMREACSYLQGEHDFRNFCKVDLGNAKTFVRRIDSCKIVESQCLNDGMQYVEVVGSAFLWHQIRLIMAVLFTVGAGLEEPSVVQYLLDIQKCPSRPSFPMAAEMPLLLHDTGYDPGTLVWKFSESNVARLVSRLHDRLGEEMIRCELTNAFLDILTRDPFPNVRMTANVNDLDHYECSSAYKRQRHRAFKDRTMCKGVDDRLSELSERAASASRDEEE